MKKIRLDTKGFDEMVKKLKKYTNQDYKTIVRAVTNDVLLSATASTKFANAKKIKESVKKRLRRPLETPNKKDIVALTKSGNVWISLKSNGRMSNMVKNGVKSPKSFVLVKKGMKTLPNKVPKKVPWKNGKELPNKTRVAMMQALSDAHAEQKREEAYRKSQQGVGASSFLYLVRLLKLKKRKHSKIKMPAYRAKLKPSAKRALRAYEKLSSSNEASITIFNAVQAGLNPNARGLTAFKKAMNGQTKRFQVAFMKDAKKYAENFATTHGFKIR